MNLHIQDIEQRLTEIVAGYGINVLAAILTLIVGFLIAGWLGRATTRALQKGGRIDPLFHSLVGRVVRVAVIIFTLIAVLNRFGVETTSLIAVLGAASLAIGLALQGTLSNVAAGVMILVFRPFKIGDAVKVGGDVYIIDSLGLFLCEAHLPDGPKAVLPNSQIWGQTLVNYSVTDQDRRRIDHSYGIAYGDDINVAIAILSRIAEEDPRILQDPAPLIKVQALGESSVDILFRAWTARADWWDTHLDLFKRCKEELEAGGMNIPFPQRDVHLHTVGDARAAA
jgi:small conductance mechanosensitive channel